MYPRTSNPGFYPPGSVIARETTRNREAVLRLLEAADCVYEVIGQPGQYCGGRRPVTVYTDTLRDRAGGWVANAGGTDTATTGRWERADPAATTSSGAKQLGTTTSGIVRPRDRAPPPAPPPATSTSTAA